MRTSIPEAGASLTAELVRSALEIAEKDFEQRGATGGLPALMRIQQFLVLQAQVVGYMASMTPGISVASLTIEQNAAVVALQTTLGLLEQPKET